MCIKQQWSMNSRTMHFENICTPLLLENFQIFKFVPCHHAMMHPHLLDMGDNPQIWRVAMNILNKQLRIANKGWFLEFLTGLTIVTMKFQDVTKCYAGPWNMVCSWWISEFHKNNIIENYTAHLAAKELIILFFLQSKSIEESKVRLCVWTNRRMVYQLLLISCIMLLLGTCQAKLEFADNSTDRDQRSEFHSCYS